MGLRLHVWSHPSIVGTVGQQVVHSTEYVPYLGACFPVGPDLDYGFSFWTPRVALSHTHSLS